VPPITNAPGLESRYGVQTPLRSAWPGRRRDFAARARRALRKYGKIAQVSLMERLTYRTDFVLSWSMELTSLLTGILLWEAIYEGAGQAQLSGFDRREMIAYLLLVHMGRMFSRTPGLALRFAYEIRHGTLKNYLLQPLDMFAYQFSRWAGYRLAYLAMSIFPYGVVLFFCRNYFNGFPGLPVVAAYVTASLLGLVVSFCFEAAIGMAGFWFLEVTAFLYVVNAVNYFVSGQMLPLDLLPPFWAAALKLLPFQYLGYFPAVVFMGKVQGEELAYGLLIELAWGLVFFVLSRWLYHRGLRRYSAYGG
jgi:ABC-2 type transport system permease protein